MIGLCAACLAVATITWLSIGPAQPVPAKAGRTSASTPASPAASTPSRSPTTQVSAYPKPAVIDRALAWARRREGTVAVAIVDGAGALHGYNANRQFQSASLAKAMLLVASLRHHPRPSGGLRTTLTAMIEESDNASADAIFANVGNSGLRAVARLAHMRDFDVGTSWIDTEMTAADQARFFNSYQHYLPARSRAFARRLLSGITALQRWGIPSAAGPAGWKVFFKGGWLGEENEVMNQAAWLEKGKVRWSLAVLTENNPTSSYGWQTQKGITGLLVGHKPTAAYLAVVHEGDADR
jgi:hypothetical protein